MAITVFKVPSGDVLHEITENEVGGKNLENVVILSVSKLTHFVF